MELVDHATNSHCGMLWVLFTMACVVGPDHQDSQFWVDIVDRAVLKSPDDMFGSVPTEPYIQSIPVGVVTIPNGFAFVLPSVCD